jgi:hypothetical protein
MQDKPIEAGASRSTSPKTQDLRDQGVVLTQILALYPAPLTVAELVREITGGSSDFEPGERFERAIRDLRGAGLLQQVADLVLPTRAALHFDALWRD